MRDAGQLSSRENRREPGPAFLQTNVQAALRNQNPDSGLGWANVTPKESEELFPPNSHFESYSDRISNDFREKKIVEYFSLLSIFRIGWSQIPIEALLIQ